MSLSWRWWIGVAAFALAMSALAHAQRSRGAMQAMGYDTAKEVTLTGTVTDVATMQAMGGGMGAGGLHLTFKSGDDTLDVHLGPQAWLDTQHYAFAKGDELTITGSRQMTHDRATMTDTDSLIARVIKKGDQTMTLRDENGRPLWAGAMR